MPTYPVARRTGWVAVLLLAAGCHTAGIIPRGQVPVDLPTIPGVPDGPRTVELELPPGVPLVPVLQASKPAAPAADPPRAPGVGVVRVGGVPVNDDTMLKLAGLDVPAAGCATCGGAAGPGGCDGRCEPFPATGGLAGRLVGSLYDTLCCPDPCYRPKWEPLADTAFNTVAARPVSQTKLGWNYTHDIFLADRVELYRARADGNGKGPAPGFGQLGSGRVTRHELYQTTEAAAGKFSTAVTTPYRSVNSEYAGSGAGFGDTAIATKSLLLDTELVLLAFQLDTTVPSGNPRKGLGVGHVSLDPSVIAGLRLGGDCFLQAQVGEWIPLGGDSTYSGAFLHYHLAYNQVLWKPTESVQLVGTLEGHGYSFQDGGFTDLGQGFRKSSGTTVGLVGAGTRLFFCDTYDFGVGGTFGVGGNSLFRDQLQVQMRVRF